MTLGKSFDPILSFFICKATIAIPKTILPCPFYGWPVGILGNVDEISQEMKYTVCDKEHKVGQGTPLAHRLIECGEGCRSFITG